MTEDQPPNSIEPEVVGKIAFCQKHLYHLRHPVVIVMIGVAAFAGWKASSWRDSGVIEMREAEIDLWKARLENSVADANQAIEQMKELGLVLAAPMLDELAVDKLVFEGEAKTLEEDVAHMQNIVICLERLGASPEQINAIRHNMDRSVMRNLRARVTVRLQAANKDKVPLFERVSHMQQWNKEQFERFIRDNNLKVPPDAKDNLLKLDYFTTNKKLPKD